MATLGLAAALSPPGAATLPWLVSRTPGAILVLAWLLLPGPRVTSLNPFAFNQEEITAGEQPSSLEKTFSASWSDCPCVSVTTDKCQSHRSYGYQFSYSRHHDTWHHYRWLHVMWHRLGREKKWLSLAHSFQCSTLVRTTSPRRLTRLGLTRW